jgi:DNA-binding LytR/AlgR family response regulator
MRCLLLDDELPGLAYLKMLCENTPGLEVVRAFNDPQKLLAEAPQLDFDLCITDIEMPGMSGLALASVLKDKMVIFTTAYDGYAADAFDLDAVDYVRKPVKAERLEAAVARAAERLRQRSARKAGAVFNSDKGRTMLYFSDVVLFRVSGSDSRDKEALKRDGQAVLLKNISFESLLQQLPDDFLRVNKKEIVSCAAVLHFVHNEVTVGGSGNGFPLPVALSETYRPAFIARMTR